DELRQRVEELLRAHDQPQPALDLSLAGATQTESALGTEERPGILFAGKYKLLERIGEGGMGTVWLAEQTEPVNRRVALKVIKRGMVSAPIIRRCEAERRSLALMDHTNIARVLDAGAADNGRPYFVMELVKGVPITKYCDQLHLSVRERLQLFIP